MAWLSEAQINFDSIINHKKMTFEHNQKQAYEAQSADPLLTSNAKQVSSDNTGNSKNAEVLHMYSGLSNQTMWE